MWRKGSCLRKQHVSVREQLNIEPPMLQPKARPKSHYANQAFTPIAMKQYGSLSMYSKNGLIT